MATRGAVTPEPATATLDVLHGAITMSVPGLDSEGQTRSSVDTTGPKVHPGAGSRC